MKKIGVSGKSRISYWIYLMFGFSIKRQNNLIMLLVAGNIFVCFSNLIN